MNKIILSGEWKAEGENPFTGEKLSLKGSVPGCALNDIVLADVEKCDPFWRDNAENFLKYERYNWHYSRKFEVSNIAAHSELVFEKLDTYCDVYLNDIFLGSCDNGHISHIFNVDDVLVVGENKVDIYFRSPITETDGKVERVAAFTYERLYTRRMQCTYG